MLSAIPNLITGLRFILVIPISVYIYQGNDLFALVLFIIAGLSDGLDGYLARRYDCLASLVNLLTHWLINASLLQHCWLLLFLENYLFGLFI